MTANGVVILATQGSSEGEPADILMLPVRKKGVYYR